MSLKSMFTVGKVSRHIPSAKPTASGSVMERPTWTPPSMSPARPGADDANQIPSMRNGKTESHKAPVAMTSSVQDFEFQKAPRNPKKGKKKCS